MALSKISLDPNLVEEKAVVFIRDQANCAICRSNAKIEHKHYIMGAGTLFDPFKTPKSVKLQCSGCGLPHVSISCAQCQKSFYCSETCKLQDWGKKHGRVCRPAGQNGISSTAVSSSDAIVQNGHNEELCPPSHPSSIEDITSPLPTSPFLNFNEPISRTHVDEPTDSFYSLDVELAKVRKAIINGSSNALPLADHGDQVNGSKPLAVASPAIATSTVGTPAIEPSQVPFVKDLYDGILEHEISIKMKEPVKCGVYWQSELDSEIFFISPMAQDAVISKIVLRIKQVRKDIEAKIIGPLEDPKFGDYCLAISNDDNQLYRAKIFEKKEDKVKVFYSDYGNFSKVTFDQVFPLPSDLQPTVIPFQSVPAKAENEATAKVLQKAFEDCLIHPTLIPISKEGKTYIVKV